MAMDIVYFDWGDVLGGNGDPQLFEHLTNEFALARSEIDTVISEELIPLFKGRIKEQEFWSSVVNRVSYAGDAASFNGLFSRMYNPILFPRQEVLAVAQKVRDAGTRTGILSNMIQPLADFCRANNYFAGFDPVIVSSEVGYMKP